MAMTGKIKARGLGMFAFVLISITSLSGCGNGEQSPAGSHKVEAVTESEHEKFEKKYSENCVLSQQKDSGSRFSNDQELGKVCECMAKELSKRISKADAVHFLSKNEFPVDMVMMTNAASNTCMAKK